MTGPGQFIFLNEAGTTTSWDDPTRSKLWRYNLHYFDDLVADGAALRRDWHLDLLGEWLDANPPGSGTGWEPFPTSLRIVNWIKAAQDGLPLSEAALDSLAVQARWLHRRIEHHLSGNHLLSNAKALCFAGAFFDDREAQDWLQCGCRILARELPEQILGDGGHYERSAMYHALVLEDLLDLVNLARRFGVTGELEPLVENRIVPMRRWLAAMSHPDHEIAFFNDAALGIAPTPHGLERYAARLGFAPLAAPAGHFTHLPDSGYLSVSSERVFLLIDVAEVGPDHQPGHAHADTLSFELSLDGRRVLANGGTSQYGTGPERQRQRGTAAHNTLTVEDQNSSEVWSGFRVGRRARPHDLRIVETADALTMTASHDGFCHLRGAPIHQRRWHVTSNGVTICDEVSGPSCRAEAFYHFSPGLVLQSQGTQGSAARDGMVILRWRVLSGRARILPDKHHPRFGVSLPSQCLAVLAQDNLASLQVIYTPCRENPL